MNWKATVLALAGVALMAAAWYQFEVKGGEARRKAEEVSKKLFPTLDPARLDSLLLQPADGPAVRLDKTGGRWNLESPLALPADEAMVQNLCQQLKNLDREETVAESAQPEVLREFGLDAAGEWVTFSGASVTAGTVWFGSKNPQGTQVYARVSGTSSVVLVNQYSKNALFKKPEDLRFKTPTPVPPTPTLTRTPGTPKPAKTP